MIRVPVALEAQSYDVVVGEGVRHGLGQAIARLAPEARSCVVITQAPIRAAGWLEGLETGLETTVVEIPEGEDHKSLATIERVSDSMVGAGLSRKDIVIGVGGGLVSDVAGFAAASYHRGIGYLTVSTSLLGQIDAAIGGKTAVNLPEGKNLVGAFWQPLEVLCDLETLSSLPAAELACGRGEMAKYAFLGEEAAGEGFSTLSLEEQVARCAAIKASFVVADERELKGIRANLNYGHTLGHALEAAGLARRARGESGRVTEMKHGEAVAVGLIFAALLAQRLGRIDANRVEAHRSVVARFDLDATLPEGLEATELIAAMGRDKKAHHDLTFVLDGPHGVEPVEGVDPGVVLATLEDMGAKR